jgi:Zn-dependent protease with chaperone function
MSSSPSAASGDGTNDPDRTLRAERSARWNAGGDGAARRPYHREEASMTHEEFDILVRNVEQGIGRDPVALKRRVTFLALSGYAGLLGWLTVIVLIACGFFAAMFWVDPQGKIACGLLGTIVLFGGGWAALRPLLVRLEPPEGRELKRAEAPRLFEVLDDLRARLRSASFHRVLLVPDCNAGVVQIPRLGVLGWSKNDLLVGLTLLDGLSADEMRAVLAHEFAHLSREHGRFSRWLYRLRRSWAAVFKQLSRPQIRGQVSLRPMLVKYVDWFWPRFNAHAFVLSRANEYEADAQAARLTGRDNMASALVRLKLVAHHLEEKLWPDLWQTANERAEPPDDVFEQLHASLHRGVPAEEGARWLDDAFRTTTTNDDTHPCLTERLRALGIEQSEAPANITGAAWPSAAETWLGNALGMLRQDVQRFWRKKTETHWRERHARAQSLTHRLSALEQARPEAAADADSLWDKALVLLDLRGNESEVEPLLRQILALRPDHAPAHFQLGRILLEDGRAEGETHLEQAVAVEETFMPQVCSQFHEYYRRMGRADKIREVAARMDRYEKAVAASRAERTEVSAKDVFIPHTLTAPELESLAKVFEAEPELVRARLAQKQMQHFPKQRFFVLCAYRRQPWHRLPNRDHDLALVRRLTQRVQLPGRFLVFAPSGSFRSLAGKVQSVSNSGIWRRDQAA